MSWKVSGKSAWFLGDVEGVDKRAVCGDGNAGRSGDLGYVSRYAGTTCPRRAGSPAEHRLDVEDEVRPTNRGEMQSFVGACRH